MKYFLLYCIGAAMLCIALDAATTLPHAVSTCAYFAAVVVAAIMLQPWHHKPKTAEPAVMKVGLDGTRERISWGGKQPPVGKDEVPWTATKDGKSCCPDCGSTEFRMGPCGGMSQNIMCGGCKEWFNMTSFGLIGGGLMIARLFQRGEDRVSYGKTPEPRAAGPLLKRDGEYTTAASDA